MSITYTKNVGFQTAFTLASLLARGCKVEIGAITFDSSYPTGGESISFGFTPDIVLFEPDGTYVFVYDHTNAKIKAYTATATEAANEADLSAVTTKAIAIKVSQ